MPPGYDPQTLLQRVLLLERQQGFQDRAAVGGLAAFARQQVERHSGASPALVAAAELLNGYSGHDRRGREGVVAGALQLLLTGVTAPAEASKSVAVPPAHESLKPATRVKPARPHLTVVHKAEDLDAPLKAIKGIRSAQVEALHRLGVFTIRDLLFYFPRAHYDFTETRSISRMRLGEKMTLVGTIVDVRNNRSPRGLVITTAAVQDDTGTVAVRWFNQPYLREKLPVGARIAVQGEPDIARDSLIFVPHDYEILEEQGTGGAVRWVPVYPLTRGLYQRALRNLIRRTLDEYLPVLEEYLPPGLPEQLDVPELAVAVERYHFPNDEEERDRARQRLAFDELLMIQLGLLLRKREWQATVPDVAVPVDEGLLERFCSSLPFALTAAQRRVIAEILDDMSKPAPMSRLVQGDVGAGKTVVAAAALLQVLAAGKQGVLMAPTEILAEQHARTLQNLLEPFRVRCELLVGSLAKARRRPVLDAIAAGEAQVVVGTHALIQEGVEFRDLGLAITDEQHRFGVEQRATLRQKGLHPHILAMTATPIPRSLAMTIYGDLDVSAIDEMPAGRLPVITTWARRPAEGYGVVRDEVSRGHQAFVICPVIEDSLETDMRSVMAEYEELQSEVFPDFAVALLHGKMKPAEKERILHDFRAGKYHILVATSVVEVGIDIPNATAMVIRDAHRFGLAQLHQFRGRVGRGGDQAYCVLLSDRDSDGVRERLEAMTALDSGFDLAEEDLRLRGPGEFWGTRQSGLPQLRVATLGDMRTVQRAREAAATVLARDARLEREEHAALRRQVERFWADAADLS